ncbi:hypothetical protein WME99_18850 [Sorangium sp. So ce136]|uniref:hypothetical protein n=1 Tax=Sorangium sp. So ce136 TaxID=3133284 RepID=UPI003F0E7F6B
MAGEQGEEDVSPASQAATYAGVGRQPPQFNACFVLGPTPSTISQVDVTTIRNTIQEWTQGDTSLTFTWASTVSSMQLMTFGTKTYRTSCTRDVSGNFNERFRIYVDHVDPPDWSPVQLPANLTIPGCSANEGIGSQAENINGNPIQDPVTGQWRVEEGYMWAMYPDVMRDNPKCLYTMHLYAGQPRNNILHESGHSLGFLHEQDRNDANCLELLPPNNGTIGGATPAGVSKMTSYDPSSVMHYVLRCPDGTTVPGNFGTTGLSASDRLAIEIMYPRGLGARITGQFAGWSGGSGFWAAIDWEMRGAPVSSVPSEAALHGFSWSVDGVVVSTASRPSASAWAALSAGRHVLRLQFQNAWNDAFESSTVVDVLPSQAAYNRRAAATLPFL